MTLQSLLPEPGRVNKPQAAQDYSDVLSQVAADGKPVIVRRNGLDLAAVVPMEHLELLREVAARQAVEQQTVQIDCNHVPATHRPPLRLFDDTDNPFEPAEAPNVNHGFVYDTGPCSPAAYDTGPCLPVVDDAAPSVAPGFKYDGDLRFKYDGNFGPMSTTGGTAFPLYDLLGPVAPTINPGPTPKTADSVNPELASKYDAIHPHELTVDYDAAPITKASPYYAGPAPMKPDPGKPSADQP